VTKFSQKIGFVGLGIMGLPMAGRLVNAGHNVNGYDTSQKQRMLAQKSGVTVKNDVAEVGRNSDLIFICLPRPKISQKVINELLNSQGKAKTVIETSTLSPEDVVGFAKKLAKAKIEFLSAPMFGGEPSAKSGKIWFVVEGEKKTYQKYQKLFSILGRKSSFVGKPPQATIAKLARNLSRFANVANAIEVIDLLKKSTNNIKPIYDLLVEDSKTNFDHVWEKAMHDYTLKGKKYQASKISVKDLNIALELAKRKKVNMPIANATKKVHQQKQA
jgi:2-hydroxy-3-oxopropionate reductase